MTPFNVNNVVWVKLTPLGERLFEEHWEHALRYSDLDVPDLERDAEGQVSFQLWELMAIFGPHTYLGADPAFEGNNIYLP